VCDLNSRHPYEGDVLLAGQGTTLATAPPSAKGGAMAVRRQARFLQQVSRWLESVPPDLTALDGERFT